MIFANLILLKFALSAPLLSGTGSGIEGYPTDINRDLLNFGGGGMGGVAGPSPFSNIPFGGMVADSAMRGVVPIVRNIPVANHIVQRLADTLLNINNESLLVNLYKNVLV
ncbi:hypothetical protein CONCODRAFT_10282 [Conidiobolus coronatus NRRL 28638]|uniref:Uncharacterized protein n=1 Tax=Conidiobolus coronatus (strain ATCC 28846 / CBS 209.66 / NRRL 28638) TaxID=796925 RepID=A0A137NY98_CONC2|nr:hypothetical protein CONCODRAFT_10282 [Conidiobolus coronatus NRRL 28638]|eukprot:KXN67624.1 hypothetical protein CONCODRAFT_10282 [Conidiobolus coronatus NRRL 28638]